MDMYAVKNIEGSNQVSNKIIPPGYVHVYREVQSLFTYALYVMRKKLLNDDSWNKKTG